MNRALAWSIAGTVLTAAAAFGWLMLLFDLQGRYPLLVAYTLSVLPGLLVLGLVLAHYAWSERRDRRRLTGGGSRPD